MTTPASNPFTPSREASLFEDGFLALRAGIFDHLNQSRFTPNDWMVYTILLRQCDWKSGRWNGNAFRIRAAVGNALTIRQIQHAMRRLVDKGYTKTFHQQGAKGNYFVLIHKYRVCVGNLRGKVLNAVKSPSYKHPVYEDECERDLIDTSRGCDRDLTWMSPSPDVDVYQDIQDVQASEDEQESNPPTLQESAGRRESSLPSSKSTPRASNDPAELWGQWLSDLLQAKTYARYTPCNEDIRRLETILSEYDPMSLAASAYLFCQRPKGFGGLSDAFGQFWKESAVLKKDAEHYLSLHETPLEALKDLHEGTFPYEDDARQRNKSLPSMTVFEAVLGLLNLTSAEQSLHQGHITKNEYEFLSWLAKPLSTDTGYDQ